MSAIQPLLRGWLLTSQNGRSSHSSLCYQMLNPDIEAYMVEFKKVREAYLPETILAYITLLHFGGRHLTRDYLMESMELSSLIAEDGSDLLDLFTKTRRLEELVQILALCSKSLLVASSLPKNKRSRSKKLRMIGRTQGLWNVQS